MQFSGYDIRNGSVQMSYHFRKELFMVATYFDNDSFILVLYNSLVRFVQ